MKKKYEKPLFEIQKILAIDVLTESLDLTFIDVNNWSKTPFDL